MRQIRGQSPIQKALQRAVGGLETAGRVRENLVFAYWDEVVGEQAAEATEPERVRDGILIVRTRSSVWSQEMTFLKSHVIKELNRRIGGPAIRDIVFKARGVTKKSPEPAEPETGPTEEQLKDVALLPEDIEAIREETAKVVDLPDEHMREALIRRISRDRRLRRWRLSHGWRLCARCTALHREETDICPICRLCEKK